MPNLYVSLPAPVADGVGAAIDTSLFGKLKTIVVGNSVAAPFEQTVTIEVSENAGFDFAPIVSLTEPGKVSIPVAARFMRVRVSGFVSGAADVEVGANNNAGMFTSLPVPAGDGFGAPVATTDFGMFKSVVVAQPAVGSFSGSVHIEASEDGVVFTDCLTFTKDDIQSKRFYAAFMRVRRSGFDSDLPGLPVVDVGAINDTISAAVVPAAPDRQSVYDASFPATIVLAAANGPIIFIDNAVPIGTLFEIQDSGATALVSSSPAEFDVTTPIIDLNGATIVDIDSALEVEITAPLIDIDAATLVDIDSATQIDITAPTIDIDAATIVDIDSATEVEITAPLVDIDASALVDIDSATQIDVTAPVVDIDGATIVDIDSATEVEISAPLVDIDGSVLVDIDGAAIDITAVGILDVDADMVDIDGVTDVTIDAPLVDITGGTLLDLNSPTEVEITSPLIDVDGTTINIDAVTIITLDAPTIDITGSTIVNINSVTEVEINTPLLDVNVTTLDIDAVTLIALDAPTIDINGSVIVTIDAPTVDITGPTLVDINSATEIEVDSPIVNIGNMDSLTLVTGFVQLRVQDATNTVLIWPDSPTFTTAPGSMFQFTGTMTHDYAAVRLGALNLQGTMIHDQAGNPFNHYLLFNNGMIFVNTSGVAVGFGPGQTFIDQPQVRADAAALAQGLNRSFLSQPNFNTVGGGTLTVTTWSQVQCFGQINTGVTVTTRRGVHIGNVGGVGGTLTTQIGLDIAALTRGGTNIAFRSATTLAGGLNIEVTGTGLSTFAGDLHMNNGVSLVLGTVAASRIELTRTAAGVMTWQGVGGVNNEGLAWDFDTAIADNIQVTSSTGIVGIGWDIAAVAWGTTSGDPTANWQALHGWGARTIVVGGDFARRLFSASAGLTVSAAMTNLFTDIVNEPFVAGGAGSATNAGNILVQTAVSFGTNRYGVLITSNPSGGTLNYALRVTGASGVRFDGLLEHTGTLVGFYGATPVVQSPAYTPTNVTTDRTYDANATTLAELADVVGTMIADLQAVGLFG